MAAFEKSHEKLGGRKKGTRNLATVELKELLGRMVSEKELEKLWRKKLYNDDEQISMKAFELMLQYRFGKPVQPQVGDDTAPPIKIDISAIPPASSEGMNDLDSVCIGDSNNMVSDRFPSLWE